MTKILSCADIRVSECEAVFRGLTELEVLAQVIEHLSKTHHTPTTTSTVVDHMRTLIRDV